MKVNEKERKRMSATRNKEKWNRERKEDKEKKRESRRSIRKQGRYIEKNEKDKK